MRSAKNCLVFLAICLVTAGCVQLPTGPEPGQYAPVMPPMPSPVDAQPGAIYQQGYDMRLFDDPKAGRIGDILTIRLVERTAASKSATTDATKDTSVDLDNPTIAGRPVTAGGTPVLDVDVQGSSSFSGEGSSSQSNQLDGLITVTVAAVLPNGNLAVSGEKWMTLNQGQEYVNVTGIVRPQDILPDNSVQSHRVADARITYSGKGAVANSNKPGWLTRFFMSPIWPM